MMFFSLLKKVVLVLIFLGVVYFVANAFSLVPTEYTPEVLFPNQFKADEKTSDAATDSDATKHEESNVADKAKQEVQKFQDSIDKQKEQLDNT